MYGVNWPNEDIDYAAEAAKRNVDTLGDLCDELKRENAELRECLKKFYDLEFPMGYEGVDGEWLALAKATEKALSKASGEEAK